MQLAKDGWLVPTPEGQPPSGVTQLRNPKEPSLKEPVMAGGGLHGNFVHGDAVLDRKEVRHLWFEADIGSSEARVKNLANYLLEHFFTSVAWVSHHPLSFWSKHVYQLMTVLPPCMHLAGKCVHGGAWLVQGGERGHVVLTSLCPFYAGKDVGQLDNDYFLVPAGILNHEGPLLTAFPVENRLLPQVHGFDDILFILACLSRPTAFPGEDRLLP